MSKTDWGNSFEFALEQLAIHWRKQHKGRSGSEQRVYNCQTCRDLWLRASAAWYKGEVVAVPMQYAVIAKLAKSHFPPIKRRRGRPSPSPADPERADVP
jgi:hypothetical protein